MQYWGLKTMYFMIHNLLLRILFKVILHLDIMLTAVMSKVIQHSLKRVHKPLKKTKKH